MAWLSANAPAPAAQHDAFVNAPQQGSLVGAPVGVDTGVSPPSGLLPCMAKDRAGW